VGREKWVEQNTGYGKWGAQEREVENEGLHKIKYTGENANQRLFIGGIEKEG